jgi:hypothetical protein
LISNSARSKLDASKITIARRTGEDESVIVVIPMVFEDIQDVESSLSRRQ